MGPLHPQVRLAILFDCCHSGSACALPSVYRPDEEGNISVTFTDVVQRLQEGAQLVVAAEQLAHAPVLLSLDTLAEAKTLLHGVTGFAKELTVVAETAIHGEGDDDEPNEDGLVKVNTIVVTTTVAKDVWMFSGCADYQTSADTSIGGVATGAMSWAFLAAMRQTPPGELSYIGLLTATRHLLKDNYAQVPQLSCGGEYDLDKAIVVRHSLHTSIINGMLLTICSCKEWHRSRTAALIFLILFTLLLLLSAFLSHFWLLATS